MWLLTIYFKEGRQSVPSTTILMDDLSSNTEWFFGVYNEDDILRISIDRPR